MTITRASKAKRDNTATHPLARLTNAEVDTVREVLTEEGILKPTTRFVYLGLEEPHKSEVLRFQSGDAVRRSARVHLLDRGDASQRDLVVSIDQQAVLRNHVLDTAVEGHLPILDEEFDLVEEIVRKDPGWIQALARRGLTVDKVRSVPMSAGVIGDPAELGRRMIRVVGFVQERPDDLAWAHPLDGLIAYLDMGAEAVTQVLDFDEVPVPRESGRWDKAPHASPARTTLKPIAIIQPEGPSFQIDDDVVTWENWSFRVGFNMREGLTLHQVSYRDGETERPVLYRASVSEMAVMYADPSPARSYISYFDVGEYLFARYTNALQLGCDCLGEIRYLDATIVDEKGRPRVLPNAICVHEEDYGVLWKHTDLFNGMQETRRQRRLVVSFFTTIGNYDYGFYWYFYLDGTIQLEAKATGVVLTSAHSESGIQVGNEIAPGLDAPYHQHMFSVRLDVMVDGLKNSVDEVEAIGVPMDAEINPRGNVFTYSRTRLTNESEAQRLANGGTGRVWQIVNPEKRNRMGQNTAYVLYPEGRPVLLADPESMQFKRARFATKHLWVTQYDPAEMYSAGDFVNQHPCDGGLPTYVAKNRNIDGEDIVLWHTFGFTHFPRLEDWPVMPVDYAGFTMKPFGFFDRNPTLDVPATPAGGHCCD